ncbi:hypothetical protein D3C74_242860 [compost metagenome]
MKYWVEFLLDGQDRTETVEVDGINEIKPYLVEKHMTDEVKILQVLKEGEKVGIDWTCVRSLRG